LKPHILTAIASFNKGLNRTFAPLHTLNPKTLMAQIFV
jgi:hypothetical protein